jgi:hypothetical protein
MSELKTLKSHFSQKRLSSAQASGLDLQPSGAYERQFGVTTGLGSVNTLQAVCGPEVAPAKSIVRMRIARRHSRVFDISPLVQVRRSTTLRVTPS